MSQEGVSAGKSRKHAEQEINHNYYAQYQKAYQLSTTLGLNLQHQIQRVGLATQRIQQLATRAEQFGVNIRPDSIQRKKKTRRAGDQIEKEYQCRHCEGERSYASFASLRTHIKLKHPQQYSPQRGRNSQSGGNSPQE